ncbi:hypothetical protein [Streptomyces sp. 058-1L]|uniref:hypothetical protein n=1 Tax=Streptomyces sp. 058-1L TaxID=2789266 RepID=UPI0039815F7B
MAATLTGCALLDLAQDCEGTDPRVQELAALDILGSRPDEATVARGFEKADAGCWADSGEVAVYAERTYAFSGTRAEVAEHYRTATQQDGWRRDYEAAPDDLCFVRERMSLRIVSSPPNFSRNTVMGPAPTSPPVPVTGSASTRT